MNPSSLRATSSAVVITFAMCCSSCSLVDSSKEYTAGVGALNAHNYDDAIDHLEKSVNDDPSLPIHQNALAAAYYLKGEYQKGWPHVRIAVLTHPHDHFADDDFRAYCKKFVDLGLIKNGFSEAMILQNLGQPDSRRAQPHEDLLEYGTAILRFQNGRLVNAGEIASR